MNPSKIFKNVGILTALSISCTVLSANAGDAYFTASISKEGKVLSQSSEWIDSVKYSSQKDWFATYEINVKPDTYQQAPAFCSASTTASGGEDDLLHGVAKLGAAPKQDRITVITSHIGKKGPSGDTSQNFMLICFK
ncbi:hypothetical protein [Pseudomonas sp. TH31]|uniref:hypothetical protein n=1 Tax=Pseudomonas sp. TH31 TaxID=2796396 RepID=UPI001913228B|nr:hypothetical protein [Pseudomonas sp. TH31]MBK5414306.1 hypothetical protein [Pseudomonas sp. TH31]